MTFCCVDIECGTSTRFPLLPCSLSLSLSFLALYKKLKNIKYTSDYHSPHPPFFLFSPPAYPLHQLVVWSERVYCVHIYCRSTANWGFSQSIAARLDNRYHFFENSSHLLTPISCGSVFCVFVIYVCARENPLIFQYISNLALCSSRLHGVSREVCRIAISSKTTKQHWHTQENYTKCNKSEMREERQRKKHAILFFIQPVFMNL